MFAFMKTAYSRKYTEEIVRLCSHFPVIGIIGARQVGKTTIGKMLREQLSRPVHYLDLELMSDLHKLENPELYLSRLADKCVVIDEIQRKPDLFPLIRALSDRTDDVCQYIITGSASPELLRQSTESLAGRIAYVIVHPFSLDELPAVSNRETHWFRGGFPRALLAPDNQLAQTWLENFVRTYTERDLPLLGLSANPVFIRRLWTMLAHTHGSVLNYSTLSGSLGVSVNTVKRYINFFEQAFLIKRIPPLATNIKKRLVKSPEVILTDTGILHVLLGISTFDDLLGHPALGNSWEGYCIMQIISKVQNNYEVSFFRTQDDAECDLVLSKSNKPVFALEIKYSAAPKLTRGNTLAMKEIAAEHNYVVVPEAEEYPLNAHVHVIGIQELIKKL